MKIKNQKFLLFPGIIFFHFIAFGQEALTPLTINPVLKHNFQSGAQKVIAKQFVQNDTLKLPFFDDFSNGGFYPKNILWADSFAFVNTTFPVNPITIGVATLDGLDEKGHPYDDSQPNTYGRADYLTSQPIDLSYIPTDSIYLSFFYQAEGLGNYPQKEDSLVLEFKTDSIYFEYVKDTSGNIIDSVKKFSDKWVHTWSDTGQRVKDFKFVMIPIIEQEYLQPTFKFRFVNYATLSGDLDQWHIDYVYLDKNRTVKDSSIFDVAFVYEPSSLLNNYEAMPWVQFLENQSALLKIKDSVIIRNNTDETQNIPHSFTINKDDTLLLSKDNGNANIPALQNIFFPFEPTYNTFSGNDSSIFQLIHKIKLTNDIDTNNNTITRYQYFQNYYAYDDGTAEAGYGLVVKDGRIAYRFVLNKPDYLRGVAMYFNEILGDLSDKNFYLTVWTSLNPETKIFEQAAVKPVYENDLNQFHYYKIDTMNIYIEDTFYVGWRQTTADILNIGFDKNNKVNSNMLYNVGGSWLQSTIQGAWMIRPLLGDTLPAWLSVEEKNENTDFKIYPNPAINYINIDVRGFATTENLQLTIYNAIGQKAIQEIKYTPQINIIGLQNGIYILKLLDLKSGQILSKIFMIGKIGN